MANARIASLEAELNASQKSQKSALAKAKKTEKALADANKEHSQREQAMTEHLRTMSAAAEGKYSFCPFVSTSTAFLHLLTFPFPSFSLSRLLCRIYRGVFVDFATG
jgi:hypothetical protein